MLTKGGFGLVAESGALRKVAGSRLPPIAPSDMVGREARAPVELIA